MFAYYNGPIASFISDSLETEGILIKCVIAEVSEALVNDLKTAGIAIDATYKHTIDNSAVRHVMKSHGSESEALRGQLPITIEDFKVIRKIVEGYDTIKTEKNRRMQDVIIYTKKMVDGITYYVEEIRSGRHELAASTIYKKKKENSPTQMEWTTQISDLSPFVQS